MTRTITVDATGTCETVPELASVDIDARDEGETAAAACAGARNRAEMIRTSIQAVPDDRIRTVDFQIRDTAEAFDSTTDAAFVARERLTVDCKPEAVEAVISETTDASGTVREVHFTLQSDVEQRLEDEALGKAMERARQKAEQLVAPESLTLGDVIEVTTKNTEWGMDSLVDEALAMHSDTVVDPSPVTVSETIEVSFEITE